MSANYLRLAMLLAFASMHAVATAQSGPLSHVGERPFPASAMQIAGQKLPSSLASGVSCPTSTQDEGARPRINGQARERIVRLFPLKVAAGGHQTGVQKNSGSWQPLPERLVATRMAPLLPAIHDIRIDDIRQTRSTETLTAAAPALRPVPDTDTSEQATAAAQVAPADAVVSHTPRPPAVTEPTRSLAFSPAQDETGQAGIYQALPPVVAFRETRPFIGMRNLGPAAFEKPDAAATEAPAVVPQHRAEPAQTTSVATSNVGPQSTPVVQRSAPAVIVPPRAVVEELAALLEHRKPETPESAEDAQMLTGPLRTSQATASTSGNSSDESAVVVKLASRRVEPADETEEVLLAVPPLPPASTPQSSAGNELSTDGLELFNPLYAVTLGNANPQARHAPGDLPENEARRLLGYQEPQYQWSGGHSMYTPNRNTYPICYQPLYFEDPNLERCGLNKGCLTELCSIACFAGRIPTLPYLMTAQSPHQCVRALPDCPACHRFGRDAYFPKPDEVNLAGVAVQSAATVGLVFLLP